MDITCPYCESSKNSLTFSTLDSRGRVWNLYRCCACTIVHLYPRPTPEELDEAYDKSYYGSGDKKFLGFFGILMDLFRRSRAARLAEITGFKGKVLDIGCGSGRFLHHLSRLGEYEIHGTELDAKASQLAGRVHGVRIHSLDLSKSAPLSETFDVITLHHVYEHVENPIRMLDNLAAMTRPGSMVEISIPNIESLQARVFKGDWLHLDPPRHLHHQPPRRLIRELEMRGFKLMNYSTISLEQNPFGLAQSLLNRMLPERDVLLERMKGNLHYAQKHKPYSIVLQLIAVLILIPFGVLTDILLSPFHLGATARIRMQRL